MQVSNWFINARVRLWKPMVEEMYVEEMKAEQDGGSSSGGAQHQHQSHLMNPNNNPSSSQASEAYNGGRHHGDPQADNNNGVGVDRKPTREQLLHDAGSLASVVNVGGPGRLENLGVMNQLDFDPYNGHQAAAGFGGGVSLTLGLQQHADSSQHDSGGVNIAFGAPASSSAHHHHAAAGYLQFAAAGGHQQQMEGGHHVQFGGGGPAAMDGEAPHGQDHHYRSQLSAGFHLLRDLAG